MALIAARTVLEQQALTKPSQKRLPLRQAVARGLSFAHYANMGVGGHREIAVTHEVCRALGIPADIATIEAWDCTATRDKVVRAFELAIIRLSR